MLNYRTLLYTFIVLSLSGCVTNYHPYDEYFGGYSDTQVNGNTAIVNYSATRNTSTYRIKDYLIYRCAEKTINAGYDFFVITSTSMSKPCPDPNSIGCTHAASAVIKMYKGPMPPFKNAYNAKSVLANYGPMTLQ